MLNHDEKRDFIRMDVDCDIAFTLAGSNQQNVGRCLTLSGAGISFVTDQEYDVGLAMEVSIHPKTSLTPPMTAFVEVVRCVAHSDDKFEVGAVIKGIKGN